jgi:branched-chain amino acid transport system permease protein
VTRTEMHNLILAMVAFAVAALLPFIDTGYALSLGVSVAMYTVLATSWTLFCGPTNYISLASAAFFGIGMYIVAAGLDYLPFPVLVAIAALAAAIFAAIIGLATLRISGVYFVIITLGLAELVRQLVSWGQHVMGSSSGLYVLIEM